MSELNLSRRGFIQGASALSFCLVLPGRGARAVARAATSLSPNALLRIDPDNTEAVVVPEGQLFMMGDNRDNSLDSRFPAVRGGGVGLVDADLLVGRASRVLWSTDGSAEWLLPWTWFSAARWNRIGSDI